MSMEKKEVINRYVCKRLRLLTWLKSKGYEPYGFSSDFANPHYNVYFFDKDEPGFKDALDEYFANK
jgi:hypothetical protein